MRFKDNELMWEAYSAPMSFGGGQDEQELVLSLGSDQDLGVGDEFESDELSDDDLDGIMDDGDVGEDEIDKLVMIELKKLAKYSDMILQHCSEVELEPWMLAKLVKAATYVCDIWDQIDHGADFANDGIAL